MQNHDDRGIIWPHTMAPFQVALLPMNMHKSQRLREATETLYDQLTEAGFDVLFDDRKVRPGFMFSDMELIGEMNGPLDVALLPIGDNFTMGIDDAVKAVELIGPRVAIPMHYNTFEVIEADPAEWARKVESKGGRPAVVKPGGTYEIS